MARFRSSRIWKLGVATGAVWLLSSAGPALSFHSGGVGECDGCHSMHNSSDGSAAITGPKGVTLPQYQSGTSLLKGTDPSTACLNCHASADTAPTSYHVATYQVTPNDSTAPVEMTPGGDFGWLKKTMTGSVKGSLTTWDGDRHGHNIVSFDFDYTADQTLTAAPGGSYPASGLACSSCHDPHGRYRRFADGTIASSGLPIFGSGSYTNSAEPVTGVSAVGVYRMLGGVGYQPKSLSGSWAFVNPPPAAVAPSSYNGVNTTIAGTSDLVAYGSGMSEWCANCHPNMHNDVYRNMNPTGFEHPAGSSEKLDSTITANYNAYVSSGVVTGTGVNYSSIAPYEIGRGQTLADYTALKAFQAAPNFADTSGNVMCLSCHRAHASGFPGMTRFLVTNPTLGASDWMTVADSANNALYDTSMTENKINMGYNTTQQTNAYNGRPAALFGPYSKQYCVKCHPG